MMTVLHVIGTRPEAIKMAPVIQEFERYPKRCRNLVCVTGQHRQMLDQVLELFGIQPDFDLHLMRPDQTLGHLTAGLFEHLSRLVATVRPDWVPGGRRYQHRVCRWDGRLLPTDQIWPR